MSSPLLRIDRVTKAFFSRHGVARALQEVSVSLSECETVGIIGESGSGKSTLGRVALGLERPDSGAVYYRNEDIYLPRSDGHWRSDISVVLQEPGQALDPRMTIGASVAEPLLVHEKTLSRNNRNQRVADALGLAHLDDALAIRYPHELSGGQQQRVNIARAIVGHPRFIVLDEPTASLDMSVRGKILDTLAELQRSLGIAYLLISHDMTTVKRLAHRTIVMYRGCVMEAGPTSLLATDPRHPYTRALSDSVLSVEVGVERGRYRLRPPDLSLSDNRVLGCVLRDRCPESNHLCAGSNVRATLSDDREIACRRLESSTRDSAIGLSAMASDSGKAKGNAQA